MSTPTQSSSLQVKRFIKAPPGSVFMAWTTPEQIKQWFGPATCRVLDAKIDLRVGGAYRFHVSSDEMGEMYVRGVYREVKQPSKLVFTWQWEDDADWTNVESVVTVELVAKDGGTEVQITHEGLPSEEHVGRHEHGWNGCLDKLSMRSEVIAEMCGRGRFLWNELVTADVEAAKVFYGGIFGWTTTPFGPEYTLFNKGAQGVGGLMQKREAGGPSQWIAYVNVEDVDATVAKAVELGGRVVLPAMDIPTVGRIAVVLDPQEAPIGLITPQG
jgi:hypothetical protein